MNKSYILKLRKLCYGLKILYVEDDINISKQVHHILKRIFHNIDIEMDGESGLKKYEENNHDLVITDILMPKMNGIVMSHKIKQIRKDQTIIVTSAYSELKYMSKLIDIGVNKFISKPVELNNFLETLAKTAIKIVKDKKKNIILDKNIKYDIYGMENPIVIIKDNKLKSVNESFKKRFLKDSDGDISEFKLSCIFKDVKMLVLENKDILKQIISQKRAYEILHIESKIYKAYKIDVVVDEEENQYLLNFINIDFVINNLEKSITNNISEFQTRRSFDEKLHSICKDDENYDIFCFGLKNLQNYITEYGANQIDNINRNFSLSIEKEFHQYIKKEEVYIYFFNTNRYILIANTEMNTQVSDRLKNFGEKYRCPKGRKLHYNLNYIVENIKKDLPIKEIINNTGAMLYMLKD